MKNLMKKIRKSNKGFTLVELIIVVAIIAILSAVVAPQYIKYVEKSRAATDADSFGAVVQAVNVLCADGTIEGDVIISVANDGTVTDNDDANDIAGAVTALTGTVPEFKSTAGSVAKSVTVAFNGGTTPTVTAAPAGYTEWGN